MIRPESTTLDFRANAPWGVEADDVFRKIRDDLAKLKDIDSVDPFNEHMNKIKKKIGLEYFQEFISSMKRKFSTAHIFHGCRITDTNSYLSKGIRLPDVDLYFELARLTWPLPNFPNLTDQSLVRIINKAIKSYPGNIGNICFLLDEEHFQSQFSSFPKIGSEFLYILQKELEKNYPQLNFGKSLGKIGQPSIICVKIPLIDNELITMSILEQFFRWMIFSASKDFNVDETNPWTLNYQKSIPAEWITIKTIYP